MIAGIQARLVLALAGAIFLLFAGVALFAYGVTVGANGERVTWQAKEKARDKAEKNLLAKHTKEVSDLAEQYNTTNRKTSDEHDKELAALRSTRDADRAAVDRAGGLRIPAAKCDRPAAGPEATSDSRHHETAAATVRLPHQVEEGLWDLADAADEVTAQARACQNWIRAHGFYGPLTLTAEKVPTLALSPAPPE